MWNADTQVFFPGGACLTCVVDTFGGRGYFGTAGGGYDFQLGGLGMGAWNPTIVVGLIRGLLYIFGIRPIFPAQHPLSDLNTKAVVSQKDIADAGH